MPLLGVYVCVPVNMCMLVCIFAYTYIVCPYLFLSVHNNTWYVFCFPGSDKERPGGGVLPYPGMACGEVRHHLG